MTPITVHVPTINDFGPADFDRLFGLWQQVNGDNLDVTFDFAQCFFLRQNAVAFLGGLIRLIQHRGGTVRMNWASLRPDVGKNLGKNGFRNVFGDSTPFGVGESIPFRQDLQPDENALMDYLKLMWLGRGWVNVSPALRDAIVGVVYEIYANAFEHGQSPIGLFSCGQHFWKRKELKLTVVDFGVGIPSNVRQFFRTVVPTLQAAARRGTFPSEVLQLAKNFPADVAMAWAFSPGTTTKPNGMGRGMGLDLLKQFVKVNNGSLEVFSHEGYTSVSKDKETHSTRTTFFEGTLVNISLTCDNRRYILSSEARKGPLF
jgi:hypothetical protein